MFQVALFLLLVEGAEAMTGSSLSVATNVKPFFVSYIGVYAIAVVAIAVIVIVVCPVKLSTLTFSSATKTIGAKSGSSLIL